MLNLTKLTLDFDKTKNDWRLTNDAADRVVKRFEKKQDATKGGVLQEVVGQGGGSVKIKTQDNRYQEERTYPGKLDPKKSPG
jgi:hypothetical protein